METGQYPAPTSGDDTQYPPTQPAPVVPGPPPEAARPPEPEADPTDPTGATWPSLSPVVRSSAGSPSGQRPPYDGYNPWGTVSSSGTGTGGYSTPPPTPPVYPGDYYYSPTGQRAPQRSGSRIPPWIYVLAVAGILGGLAVGIGLGRASSLPGLLKATASSTPTVSIGAASAPIVSVPSDTASLQTSVQNVVKAVLPSVVEITADSQNQESIGSGNILTSDGYIVTNDHVVDGFSTFTVTFSNGKTAPATIVGTDPQDDLAVIKVAATNLRPIAIGDSNQATVGEFVVALGTPLGERNTATFGIVSALNRTESEGPDGPASTLTGLIQTSAPITNGNSGGALVNLKGELLGIPTLGASNQRGDTTNIGFAIPSNQVKTVAQQLIQSGQVTSTGKPFLGIRAQDVTPDLAAADGLSVQSGVLVSDFANDASGHSPAQRAGIQRGDVITAINGQPVSDNSSLASALAGTAPGTSINVTIVRGTSQQTISVTLGERPTNTQG